MTYLATRILPDGRGLYIYPLTFSRARLGISPPGDTYTFTDEW
jgi:hypothetical protein